MLPGFAWAASAALSAQGQAIYVERCAVCHAVSLEGGSHGPTLLGAAFVDKWQAKQSGELISFIAASMPPGQAGALAPGEYRAVGEYIAAKSGLDARWKSVTASRAEPSKAAPATDDRKPEGLLATIARMAAVGNRSLDHFNPVTEEALSAPPPGEWLNWRRTRTGFGDSPLDQINTANVSSLRLAWSLALPDGASETTPLVRDGTMFVLAPRGKLFAVDAKTGDFIWEYRYVTPTGDGPVPLPNRNIALYQDLVFITTSDAATVAVDARTGQQRWRAQNGNPADGFQHTAGPVVAHGVVITGLSGCERFKETPCAVIGRDPQTGRELWRTSSIAGPGEPGGDTWGGRPREFRAGGDMWMPGTYDPGLDTFFIGTAQAKPWAAASRQMSVLDPALYTNSTLAIDPTSGKLKWWFQHSPGDSLDLDDVFERILIDAGGRKLLFTSGKLGILWKLDRETGKYLDHTETVYQDIVTSVDRNTGHVTYRPDILNAKLGDVIKGCPGPASAGAHSWLAMSYDEHNGSLIIPLTQMCGALKSSPVEFKLGGGAGGGGTLMLDDPAYPAEMPGSNGNFAKLAAYDIHSMKQLWSHQQKVPFTTATLSTAGGLVFVGDGNRYFKAFDSKSGKQLWQTRLGTSPQGYPITYAVDGKQYLAVAAGQLGAFLGVVAIAGKTYHPPNGNAMYVFELP